MLLQEADSPIRTAVGIGKGGGHILRLHRGGLTGCVALFRRQLVEIVAHVIPIVRIPAVGTFAEAKIVAAVEVPLADVCGADPVVTQTLADRVHICGQCDGIRPAVARMRIQARKKGCAGGLTDRLRGVRLCEAHPLRGQPIKAGRFQPGMHVGVDHVVPLGIRHDKNNLCHKLYPLFSLLVRSPLLRPFPSLYPFFPALSAPLFLCFF